MIGAYAALAGHARQARQLRCSPLSQGRTPRGQHVGSCCLCPTSLRSGDGAAPASAERSGLPVACVKLIAGKREHFLGRWGKGFRPRTPRSVGVLTCIRRGARKSPLIRPAGFARGSVPRPACRGPHLYPKVRPEVAFDPSRRICSGFRPEAGLPGPSPVSEGAPGSCV